MGPVYSTIELSVEQRKEVETLISAGNFMVLTQGELPLTERIQAAEERLATVNEEVAALRPQTIDEADLKMVLSQFDPIWESLTPKERARVVRLLVARVGYDGKAEKVSVTFSPAGVRLLAEEMHPCEEEVLV